MYTTTTVQIGPKDYNTRTTIDFPESVKTDWTQYRKTKMITENLRNSVVDAYTSGYGMKMIGHSLPSCTYMLARSFILKVVPKDQVRTGRSVVTPFVAQLRSDRLKDSADQPWKRDDYQRQSTGIQGYFYYLEKKYWLRSAWEYAYVKWLIKNGIEFTVEEKVFLLNDGRRYRPDFFIYADGKLSHIVEIKGQVFHNNADKPSLLEEQIGIKVSVINDIEPYCEVDYGTTLNEWKEYLKNTGQKVKSKAGIKF